MVVTRARSAQKQPSSSAIAKKRVAQTRPAQINIDAWVCALQAIAESWCTTPPQPQPCQLASWLLLSDAETARKAAVLRSNGITHVLNAASASESSAAAASSAGAAYKQLDAEDHEHYPILTKHWNAAWEFMSAARAASGRVLVHCQGGVNRSGCLVAAALMMDERISVVEAVQRCKLARGTVLLNAGFRRALVRFAASEGLLGEV